MKAKAVVEGIGPELMAVRIVHELVPGTVVNIGAGLGFHVANLVTPELGIQLHAENGLIGWGRWTDDGDDADPDCQVFAQPVELLPGAVSVDHVTSFGLVRSGRIHTTVLGAMEVDEYGRMANWWLPRMSAGGVGGAVELLRHCPRVIVAMRHCDPAGRSKVRRQCETPLTGQRPVDLVVTDLAVLRPTGRGALELLEVAPGLTVDDVLARTEATVVMNGDPAPMRL